MTTPELQDLDALPLGTEMQGYVITGIVGRGGFGLVYVACDSRTQRSVAIKEYLPVAVAGRGSDGTVAPRSEQFVAAYARGLKGFLEEAERLAEFSHPALVAVHRAWEANGTAYMAMQYYPGKTLREVRLAAKDGMSQTHIRRLMAPVFDAVSELHAHRIIHRDVSPDNILVTPAGDTVLLDLGAARQVLGGMTQALTTILKPGFAPIEQYVDDGSMEQGRWTDVYALGAVIYFLASGKPPTSATSRVVRDTLPALADVAQGFTYSVELQTAVTRALSLRAIERYKSTGEFRNALGWTQAMRVSPSKVKASVRPLPASTETTEFLSAYSAADILRKTTPESDLETALLPPKSVAESATSSRDANVSWATPAPSTSSAASASSPRRGPRRESRREPRREPRRESRPAEKNVEPTQKKSNGFYVGMGIGLMISAVVIWKLFFR
jgi:serine/threonine protein kinase